jgi:thiamine biosynthesis lipoprotein ApbE
MHSICVDSFMFENGERYCHIVNKNTGEPSLILCQMLTK